MPTPQVISPSDSLELGFRGAHNNTALSVPITASIDNAGLITFRGLNNAVLFTCNAATILALKSEIPPAYGGEALPFNSATDELEGTARFSTPTEALSLSSEFTMLSPQTLGYILENLEFGNKTLLELSTAASGGDKSTIKGQLAIRLEELSELIAHRNLTIDDIFNLIFNKPAAAAASDRGIFFNEEVSGNTVTKGYMGRSNAGHMVLSLDYGRAQVEIVPGQVQLNTGFVNAGEADVLARTGAYVVAPLASKPLSNLCTLEPDDITGVWRLRAVTPDQLTAFSLPGLQPVLAQMIAQVQVGGPPEIGIVKQICYYTRNIKADTQQDFTINSANLNTWLTHNIQTPGEEIWYELRGPNGKDALNYMSVSFNPANNYEVKVTADDPESGTGPYQLRLSKRNVTN